MRAADQRRRRGTGGRYVFVADEGMPGRLIGGRFRLIAEIGSGGMGRIWEARDERLHRPVAVKEVQIHVASSREREDRLTRAKREGRNAAALADHPNVVTVYDVVIEDGVPWIVMQLVRGQSLRAALESGPLDVERVAGIARALLSALGAVHTAGMVHRDVKPGNVMLADDGRVLLTDFGIAKSGGDETVTATGEFVGSLGYTAPERVEGEPGGPASDLFSVGVTLFHAVEGIPPFHRESKTAILTAILIKPLPQMTRATGGLRTLIEALTMKNPGDRPGVDEALELLEGTRKFWGPLAAAETIDAQDRRPAHQAAPVPKTGPRPPWQTAPLTSVDSPIPPLPNQSQAPDRPPRDRRNRILAVACAIAVTIGAAAWAVAVSRNHGSAAVGNQATATTGSATTPGPTPRDSLPTSPTTASKPPTTSTTSRTTFDPGSLDSAGTDQTPLTSDALLPRTFTDSKGVVYNIRSGGVEDCVNWHESGRVQSGLSSNGCRGLVVGTYTDTADHILVVVVVAAMPDATAATSARADLTDTPSVEWGMWCPPDGPGSQTCRNPTTTISRATQTGYIGTSHRYVTDTLALYINLEQNDSVKPWVGSAALAASYAIGPQNYSGNR